MLTKPSDPRRRKRPSPESADDAGGSASSQILRLRNAETSNRPPTKDGSAREHRPEHSLNVQLMTVAECAAMFRVSEKTIRRHIKAGKLRTAPIGGRTVRIPIAEVRRMAGLSDHEDLEERAGETST